MSKGVCMGSDSGGALLIRIALAKFEKKKTRVAKWNMGNVTRILQALVLPLARG
jgi:hypothetical protein